jgi:hypothetical protein
VKLTFVAHGNGENWKRRAQDMPRWRIFVVSSPPAGHIIISSHDHLLSIARGGSAFAEQFGFNLKLNRGVSASWFLHFIPS